MRRSSIITSACFHLAAVIIAIVGLPFLSKKELVLPQPMVVEFVELSKITQTTKVTPKPAPPKEEPKKEAPPPPPPKNTASEVVKPVEKPIETPPEKPDPVKEKPVPEIDPAALPDKKKPPVKKPVKKPIEKPAEKLKPEKDFSSVLKNLSADKEAPKPPAPETNLTDVKESAPDSGENAPLGEKMTMSEEDALRSQLEKCWNVPYGAKDAEDMVVEIYLVINPDRTLREAKVVDQSRYNSDTFYRAAADSALRAEPFLHPSGAACG
jgi:outer membrane biosynthesis protein TonB